MINWGSVPIGSVLPFIFGSYDGATGASEALSGLAVTDIEIYKDISTTQRSSDAGYTLMDTDGIDVDGITGINGFSIDTGDDTDTGFYSVGSFFTVVVASVTIDGQTVNFIAGTFRLVAAESTVGTPKADVGRWKGSVPADLVDTDKVSISVQHMANDVITNAKIADNAFAAEQFAADFLTSAKIADDAIASEHIATDAITADSLAASANEEIADALLNRTISGGANGGRDVTSALRGIRNKVDLSTPGGGTGTVYEEDDTTTAYEFSYATGARDPLTSVNPTS